MPFAPAFFSAAKLPPPSVIRSPSDRGTSHRSRRVQLFFNFFLSSCWQAPSRLGHGIMSLLEGARSSTALVLFVTKRCPAKPNTTQAETAGPSIQLFRHRHRMSARICPNMKLGIPIAPKIFWLGGLKSVAVGCGRT